MPGAELKKNYWRIRVRDPKDFEKGSFRTDDIGRKGHSLRIAGILKKSGKWATQSWLLHKDDVRVVGKTISGKDLRVQKIIQGIRSNIGKIRVRKHRRRVK